MYIGIRPKMGGGIIKGLNLLKGSYIFFIRNKAYIDRMCAFIFNLPPKNFK